MISRRGVIGILATPVVVFAAPAIVRVSALMPISVLDPTLLHPLPTGWYQNLTYWVSVNGKTERVVPPESLDHAMRRLADKHLTTRRAPILAMRGFG